MNIGNYIYIQVFLQGQNFSSYRINPFLQPRTFSCKYTNLMLTGEKYILVNNGILKDSLSAIFSFIAL
jgi:hypothetical protein